MQYDKYQHKIETEDC